MCLAIPGTILSIEGTLATIDYGGLTKRADVTLAPAAKTGDAVIVHAGFVIAVLNKAEGEELIALAKETGQYD